MESLGNILETKTSKTSNGIFVCELCHYNCCKKFNWDRHILSSKHIKETNGTNLETKYEQNEQNKEFACENCNKEFKTRSGLWKHKKGCCSFNQAENTQTDTTNTTTNAIIIEKMFAIFTQLVTQNQDFMTNVIGKVQGITNNNNINTTNNNQFNINMFLNEHCKNAMNITDFIRSLPITAQDYENTKDRGLADTLTHLIVDGLNNLDVLDRPIHCTDQKRKTMYVKDNDIWEKDDNLNIIMASIRELTFLHRKHIDLWKGLHPEYEVIETLQIAYASMIEKLFTDVTDCKTGLAKLLKGISTSSYIDNETKMSFSQ